MTYSPPRIVDADPIRPRRRIPRAVYVLGSILICAALIGVLIFTGGLTILIAAFGPGVTLQDSQSRTLTVTDLPTIAITNAVGSITIQAGAKRQVTVQAMRLAHDFTRSTAQDDLATIILTTKQQDATLTITGQADTIHKTPIGSRKLRMDLVITVPAVANVTVTNGIGDVYVAGVSGVLILKSAAGTITLNDSTLSGKSAVQTNSGSVVANVGLAPGAALTIGTASGDVTLTLPAAAATHLDCATRAGTIAITGWPLKPQDEHLTGASLSGNTAPHPIAAVKITVDVGNITLAGA